MKRLKHIGITVVCAVLLSACGQSSGGNSIDQFRPGGAASAPQAAAKIESPIEPTVEPTTAVIPTALPQLAPVSAANVNTVSSNDVSAEPFGVLGIVAFMAWLSLTVLLQRLTRRVRNIGLAMQVLKLTLLGLLTGAALAYPDEQFYALLAVLLLSSSIFVFSLFTRPGGQHELA